MAYDPLKRLRKGFLVDNFSLVLVFSWSTTLWSIEFKLIYFFLASATSLARLI